MDHTRNYFDYKGVRYGVGTIVKIKWEPYGSRIQIERCDGVAEFVGGFESGYLKFVGESIEGCLSCNIGIRTDPNDRIEKIIKPVYYENRPVWQTAAENYKKTPRACRADIAPGTILYIAAMLVLAIFKNRWLGWIAATLLYLKYLIDIYRD